MLRPQPPSVLGVVEVRENDIVLVGDLMDADGPVLVYGRPDAVVVHVHHADFGRFAKALRGAASQTVVTVDMIY